MNDDVKPRKEQDDGKPKCRIVEIQKAEVWGGGRAAHWREAARGGVGSARSSLWEGCI